MCARLRDLIPGTHRVAFADGIKADIADVLGAPAPNLYHKPYSPEIRRLLQWWGTELRRETDPEYWVNRTLLTLEEKLNRYDLVVITDVRYRNEADTIRALHGMVVEVHASDTVREHRLGGLPPEHASELLDFPVDSRISNLGPTVLTPDVAEFVGLDPMCFNCRCLARHPFHDSGRPTGWTPELPGYLVRA